MSLLIRKMYVYSQYTNFRDFNLKILKVSHMEIYLNSVEVIASGYILLYCQLIYGPGIIS